MYEPFGPGRGAVIAKRDHMLVMALGEAGGNTFCRSAVQGAAGLDLVVLQRPGITVGELELRAHRRAGLGRCDEACRQAVLRCAALC
jgi:hypothetical protein